MENWQQELQPECVCSAQIIPAPSMHTSPSAGVVSAESIQVHYIIDSMRTRLCSALSRMNPRFSYSRIARVLVTSASSATSSHPAFIMPSMASFTRAVPAGRSNHPCIHELARGPGALQCPRAGRSAAAVKQSTHRCRAPCTPFPRPASQGTRAACHDDHPPCTRLCQSSDPGHTPGSTAGASSEGNTCE